jgi:hypothetical protein
MDGPVNIHGQNLKQGLCVIPSQATNVDEATTIHVTDSE